VWLASPKCDRVDDGDEGNKRKGTTKKNTKWPRHKTGNLPPVEPHSKPKSRPNSVRISSFGNISTSFADTPVRSNNNNNNNDNNNNNNNKRVY
jgi:hypothetical protein